MAEERDLGELISDFCTSFRICYCRSEDRAYQYDGGVFKPLLQSDINRLIDIFIAENELEWDPKFFDNTSKHIQTKATCIEKMGAPKGYVILQNGVFKVGNMSLVPHSAKFHAISALPFDYDPDAECPVFDDFIADIANGNVAMEDSLIELLGYAAAGYQKAGKLFLFCGQGANGKSVFIDLMGLLVGKELSRTLSVAELNGDKAFDRAGLQNARLVKIHELGKKTTFEDIFDANIKKAVTGEEIDSEMKFRQKMYFKPSFNIVIASNYFPQMGTMPSESVLRRLFVLNFTGTFTGDRCDPDILKKMSRELPGIFNRAMEGLERLKKKKFVFSAQAESDRFMKRQVNENFPLYGFVREKIKAQVGSKELYKELNDAYRQWAGDNGLWIDEGDISVKLRNTLKACHIPIESFKSNGDRGLVGIKIIE